MKREVLYVYGIFSQDKESGIKELLCLIDDRDCARRMKFRLQKNDKTNTKFSFSKVPLYIKSGVILNEQETKAFSLLRDMRF